MRTPFDLEQCYDYGLKIATRAQRTATILPWASIKKAWRCPSFLHGCHKPRRHRCRILAIEKFDQFRDHLVRRLFHQPVASTFDEYALDIGRHHLALLDQERTAGFFA
jgi:hypothetical protein